MTAVSPGIRTPLAWSTASSLGTQALSFLTFAVLARLLGAQAFGVVALAAMVIDLLMAMSTAGMTEAVIQRRVLDEKDADTAFWANLACGLWFCFVTIATAPLLARLFNQPEIEPIIQALASIFAITPLGAIHTARLTRELRFKSVALRNITASLAGAAVGLPLALAGFGVWALVWQRIAMATALVISAWVGMHWLPRLRFQWATCCELVRFGGYISLSNTLNQINIRSAEVISGALVGPLAVAFIRAGSRIVEVLNQITYMPFHQIAMPLLARTAHDRKTLRDTYLRLSRLSAFIMFPAFLGSFALADEIIELVFGPGWAPVADALRIFACAVVASQMNNLIVAAITATGAGRTVLSWTTAQIVLGGTAALAVSDLGWQAMLVTGVARGYLVLPYGFYLLRQQIGVSVSDVLRSLRPAATSTCLMIIVVLTGVNAGHAALAGPAAMIIWMPVGVIVYLAAYIWQDRTILDQLREIAAARLRRTSDVAR